MMPIRAMLLRQGALAPATDPFWANVTSLLHFDGGSGSSYLDQRGNTWTNAGDARQSSDRARFGPSSLNIPTTTSRISSSTALGAGVGTGDFTIEGFFYATSQAHRGLFHTALTSSAAGIALGHENVSGGQWQVYFGGSVFPVSSQPLAVNQWSHFALVRSGTAGALYINGVQILTFTSSANVTNTGMVIGAYFSTGFTWGEHIDEFRITVGVARYTSSFTPPSAAFPDS